MTSKFTSPEGKTYKLFEDRFSKKVCGPDYNYVFSKRTGAFMRWGAVKEDDPQWSPIGPEILDIEITDVCRGVRDESGHRAPCVFCYKSNGPGGRFGHMTLETFKGILAKMGPQLTQVAFGVDAEGTANPDTFAIMRHCRESGVIPNVTIADITPETADQLAEVCGAVAVSYYPERDKNRCYDAVKMLTDRGMTQINIHAMASLERYDMLLELLEDRKTDPRLQKMNAIVFLSLKKKGRGSKFNRLGSDRFKNLIDLSLGSDIPIGFDSCSFHLFEEAVRNHPQYDRLMQVAEPCESGVFSSYIDVSGSFFPCSFYEGSPGWETGIDVLGCESFGKDIWRHQRTQETRGKLLEGCRRCPIYDI